MNIGAGFERRMFAARFFDLRRVVLCLVVAVACTVDLAAAQVSKPFLMTFDTCPQSNCTGPKASLTQLAQSDDGIAWQPVPGFPSVNGGVPSVVRRGDTIYVFSDAPTGGMSAMQVQRYRMSGGGYWEAPVTATIDDPYATGPTIDTNVVVNSQGQLVFIYDTNPKLCSLGVCHLRAAIEVPGTDGTAFSAQVNDLFTGSYLFGDSSTFFDGSQFVTYMPAHSLDSTSAGPNGIGVYTSASLTGPYSLAAAFAGGNLFPPAAGVNPGWATGLYNPARGQYWNYVNYQNVPGPPVLPGPIYRAVKSQFGDPVSASDLTPVITPSSLGFSSDTVMYHQHVTKNWAGTQTISATVSPTTVSAQAGVASTITVTLRNNDTVTAADCYVAPMTVTPSTFSYQAIAPLSAAPNTPVPVAGNGGTQTFSVSLTPNFAIPTTEMHLAIGCASSTTAAQVTGVNTVILTASGPAAPTAFLENPGGGSYASGIGLISGWSCNGNVSVAIDGIANQVAYGTPRGDAASMCGGNANIGFGQLINYNLLGSGSHTAQLLVDGKTAGDPVSFAVATLGSEFFSGINKQIVVSDFPQAGYQTTLIWQQSQQNFAIGQSAPGNPSPLALPGLGTTGDAHAALENPSGGSYQSGINLISGWSCSSNVAVSIDGSVHQVAYGTARSDAASMCGGNAAIGFGLLLNYSLLGSGAHTAQLLVNGAAVGTPVPFAVTTLGSNFLTGVSRVVDVPDFPQPGKTATLIWQQALQNFEIVGMR